MGRYQFRLATEADDAGLRALMAATPMDGAIAVRFLREPSFFDAAAVDGAFRQIAVCEDTEDGRLVGVGSRSTRTLWVNGAPRTVGYLSSLRGLPEVRGRTLLAGAYRFLKTLHEADPVDFYLSTIAEGNDAAMAVLISGRAGLPVYRDQGALHTAAIPIPRRTRSAPLESPDLAVRPAGSDDIPAVLAFLERLGPRSQFFPRYTAEDFTGEQRTFRALEPGDMLLAFRKGELAGVLAGWDQHSFKQTVVDSYSGWLHWLRPVYNAYSTVRGLPALPAPGAPFRYVMGALPLVEDNDPSVFAALLDAVLARHSGQGKDYVLVGLHEAHPLLKLVRRRATTCYVTRLYAVYWEEPLVLARLDGRVPYLELGCL